MWLSDNGPGLEKAAKSSHVGRRPTAYHTQVSGSRGSLLPHVDFSTAVFEMGFVHQLIYHVPELHRRSDPWWGLEY
jgi:hypothetical protein